MNAEILKNIGVMLGGIIAAIAPYVVKWLSKRLKKDEEGKDFLSNTQCRTWINEALVDIRATVGANRVSLVEYHNGNTTINGLPFNYASMTYEKTDSTTKDLLTTYQKIPISQLCEVLLEIHNSLDGYIKIGQDYANKTIVELNNYYGVETMYVFRIGSHIKYGTVHLMWINEDPELTEEDLDKVHFKVMYINDLMSRMKKH